MARLHRTFGFLLLLVLQRLWLSECLDNGLAKTPPMGWLTWERFRCNTDCKNFPATCIGERLIKETADRLSLDGYLKAGYQYITVDDCWMSTSRDSSGQLVADKTRFPNGMKAVADYVHSRGLKFGIYADFGTKTCGGYPGSEFYLQQDANTFASWGVDLVKFDGCYSNVGQQVEGYEAFGFFLNKTGRPMVYSCSWPAYQEGQKTLDSASLIKTCSMWRMFGDIQDSWDSVISIINTYKKNPHNFSTWAGPSHWNDPDMLILGDFGLSYDQQRAQMGMWSMFAAPMMISTDLRQINNASKALILNPRLIAINQDPLGVQGTLVLEQGSIQLWKRPLHDGSTAVAILNANTAGIPTRLLVKLSNIGMDAKKKYNVTDAFDGKRLGTFAGTDNVPFVVNPTGIVLVVLKVTS